VAVQAWARLNAPWREAFRLALAETLIGLRTLTLEEAVATIGRLQDLAVPRIVFAAQDLLLSAGGWRRGSTQ
jgi:hypothetical protein